MSLRAKRSNLVSAGGSILRQCVAAAIFALTCLPTGAPAAPAQDCVKPAVVLWGDGKHDDTVALNAWLRGENALWGDSGGPVGAVIAGRDFRLSSAIYVTAGSGRIIENFRLIWPDRGETVAGGAIRAGSDPDAAPVTTDVHIVGGDSGEGKPFDSPDAAKTAPPNNRENCGIS